MSLVSKTTADLAFRIYLGATFRDFLGERRYLHTVFLPKVRWQWERFGLSVELVDPGWDDAKRSFTSPEAVEGDATLSESLHLIDSCRPHFLCFLGQRYGKGFQKLTAQLVKVIPWIKTCRKGISRLHLEMHHGFLQKPDAAPHAYVYLRGDDYFPKQDEEAKRINLPDDEEESKNLMRIGPDLETANRPLRPYDCKWDAALKESCDFNGLRDQLLADFTSIIRSQSLDFPDLKWEDAPAPEPAPAEPVASPPLSDYKPTWSDISLQVEPPPILKGSEPDEDFFPISVPAKEPLPADAKSPAKINPLDFALEELLDSDPDLPIRPSDLIDPRGKPRKGSSGDLKIPDWMDAPNRAEQSPLALPAPKQVDLPVEMPKQLPQRPLGTVADFQIDPLPPPVPKEEPKAERPAGKSSASTFDENVQFTVFRPRIVEPEWWYDLLAFAHLGEKPPDAPPGELDPYVRVSEEAKQFLGPAFESFTSLRQEALHSVPKYGEITFVPDVPRVEFNPPMRTFKWVESVHREDFRFRAETALDGQTARGKLSVYLGAILLGEVPIALRVQSDSESLTGAAATDEARSRPYRKIFASYSHDDATIVDQVESVVKLFGDDYLRDSRCLRAGQVWGEELQRMIREADVFQLFWSSRSMMSQECRREWEYALSLNRPDFVRPTYWEQPMPRRGSPALPPEELARLHFQFIGVQVDTRAELIYPVKSPPDSAGGPAKAEEKKADSISEKATKPDSLVDESFDLSDDSGLGKPMPPGPVPPPVKAIPKQFPSVPPPEEPPEVPISDEDTNFKVPLNEEDSSLGFGSSGLGGDLLEISEEELLRGNTGMGFQPPPLNPKLKPEVKADPKSPPPKSPPPKSPPPRVAKPGSDADPTMPLAGDSPSPSQKPENPEKPKLGGSGKLSRPPAASVPPPLLRRPAPKEEEDEKELKEPPQPSSRRRRSVSREEEPPEELPSFRESPRREREPDRGRKKPPLSYSDSEPIAIDESDYYDAPPKKKKKSLARKGGLPTWLIVLIGLVILGAIGLVTVLILRG